MIQSFISISRHRLLELAWWRPFQASHEARKECGHGLWILRPDVAHLPREWQIQFAVRDDAGYLGQTLRPLGGCGLDFQTILINIFVPPLKLSFFFSLHAFCLRSKKLRLFSYLIFILAFYLKDFTYKKKICPSGFILEKKRD